MATAYESSMKEAVKLARLYWGSKIGKPSRTGKLPFEGSVRQRSHVDEYKSRLREMLVRMGRKFNKSIVELHAEIEQKAKALGPLSPYDIGSRWD